MRRAATDTEPLQTASDAPEPSIGADGAEVELLARVRGFANELAELTAALGGLASAEASQSLTAFLRMLELRALGVVLGSLALVGFGVGAALVLADLLGSPSAALFGVAAAALLAAGLALWRARVWRARIGFAETRAALAAEPQPPEAPRP
jgi:uncharacterized membrane protein YqjE